MQEQPTARYFIAIFRNFEQQLVEAMRTRGFTDVTPAHLNVMRHINPEGIRLTELAKDAAMSKQAVAKTVNELVKRRYLRIENDKDDGRAVTILYTPRGKQLIGIAVAFVVDVEEKYRQLLGADRYNALRDSLQLLYRYHKGVS